MVREFGTDKTDQILRMSAQVGEALNVLAKIDEIAGYRITQKWIFVDLLWLIMQRQSAGAVVDATKAASHYLEFEKRRREFNSRRKYLSVAVGTIRSSTGIFTTILLHSEHRVASELV